jgi:signal peptidase I
MTETDAATMTDDSAPARAKTPSPGELKETLKTIGVVAAIFLVVRIFLFQPFTIPSASMEPTVMTGDYLIISKFAYGFSRHSIPFSPPLFKGRIFDRMPQRGDIIVFKLPRDGHTDYIKRLIGLPGDRIQMRAGVLYLNGKPVPREMMAPVTEPGPMGLDQRVLRFRETLPDGKSYVTNAYGFDGEVDNTGIYVVPAKSYFFLGDNRDNSADSRYPEEIGVGFVPEENLVGKADLVLMSWNDKASLFKPWTWILDLRPSRFFRLL